jgi:hypothetical protein
MLKTAPSFAYQETDSSPSKQESEIDEVFHARPSKPGLSRSKSAVSLSFLRISALPCDVSPDNTSNDSGQRPHAALTRSSSHEIPLFDLDLFTQPPDVLQDSQELEMSPVTYSPEFTLPASEYDEIAQIKSFTKTPSVLFTEFIDQPLKIVEYGLLN